MAKSEARGSHFRLPFLIPEQLVDDFFTRRDKLYVSNKELWKENIGTSETPRYLTHYQDFEVYAYGLPTSLPSSTSGTSAQSDAPENLILSGLSLSGISLSPYFSPDTLFYTAQVDFDVASTTVTATPNDSEASVSILWNVPGSSWSDAGEVPRVSLREGDNIIIVEVTVRNGFSRLRYFIEVTKLEVPPVSGGPLPLSYQPSSLADKSSRAANSPTADWKSRLMAADSLPNGGVGFVFLVSAEEFQIEETVDLLSGEWRPLAADAFQATRESSGQGQDRLTVILPRVERKHRFLRLTSAPQSEETLRQDILPGEAILFPFSLLFFGGCRQNRGGLKEGIRIMKNSPLLFLFGLLLAVFLSLNCMAQDKWDHGFPVSDGGWRFTSIQFSELPNSREYNHPEWATHTNSLYAPLYSPKSVLHGRTRIVADAILLSLYALEAIAANEAVI